MKYRRKQTTIEAIKWTGENLQEVKNLFGDSLLVYEDDIFLLYCSYRSIYYKTYRWKFLYFW